MEPSKVLAGNRCRDCRSCQPDIEVAVDTFASVRSSKRLRKAHTGLDPVANGDIDANQERRQPDDMTLGSKDE